jgi:hypothetical protein
LANWSHHQRQLAKSRRRPRPVAAAMAPSKPLRSVGSWGGVWVVFLVLSSLIKLGSNLNRQDTPARSFRSPAVPTYRENWDWGTPDFSHSTAPFPRRGVTAKTGLPPLGQPTDPATRDAWIQEWLKAERQRMEQKRDSAPKSTARSPSSGTVPR